MLAAVVELELFTVVIPAVPVVALMLTVVLGLVVPALPVNVAVSPVADVLLVTAPDEDVVAVVNPIICVGAVAPAAVVISGVPAAVLIVVVVLEPVVPALPVNEVVSPDSVVPFAIVTNEDTVAVVTWTVLPCNVVPAAVIVLELVTVVTSPVPGFVLRVPVVVGLAVPALPGNVVVPRVFVTDGDVVTSAVFVLGVVLAAIVVLEGVAVVTSAVPAVVLMLPVVLELVVPVLPVTVAVVPVPVVPLVIVADEKMVGVVTWPVSVLTAVPAVVLVREPVDVASSLVPTFEVMVTVVLELVACAPPADVTV